MKKIFYLVALVTLSSLFVQCEKNNDEIANEKHEYIDLGLSVKWATCNVGATTPEQYGDYFAWGEVKPKRYYDWGSYKYCVGSESTLTKYCFDSDYGKNGFTDDKTILDLEDDAAHVNWGGNWRMPTVEECEELEIDCEWTWTTLNGINGHKVTGPNGNSIFLPAAGAMGGDVNSSLDEQGWYWSSSIANTKDYHLPSQAYYIGFTTEGAHTDIPLTRRYGFSVRAVCP